MTGPFRHMAKPTLDELRAQAVARRRAVSQKISRLKRNNNVNIAGTEIDPRTNLDNIRKMNRRQLESTVKKYDKFTDRSVQFYGDAERRPIPAAAWKAYKKVENQFNQASRARFAPFANTSIPGSDHTAGEYRAATRSKFSRAADPAVNDPYREYNRSPNNIASARKLVQLTRDLKRKASDREWKSELKSARKENDQMFDVIGSDKIKDAVAKLTDKQFEWLWNVSPFAKAASRNYSIARGMVTDKHPSWYEDKFDDQIDDMMDYIDAARKIE